MTRLRSLFSEPLVHFAVIGLGLFLLDRALPDKGRVAEPVVVDAAAYEELADAFAETRGRLPTEAEFAPLIDRWVRQEVLIREAKAAQMDVGDPVIDGHLARKMWQVIKETASVAEPKTAELRAWFEERRALYDVPALYSLTFVRASTKADALNVIASPATLPADRTIVFKERPRSNVIDLIGADRLAALDGQPPGSWQAMETKRGWAAVRLDAFSSAVPAQFDEISSLVRDAWVAENQADVAQADLDDLVSRYKVITVPPEGWVFSPSP